MNTLSNVPLMFYTSLHVGGPAEKLLLPTTHTEMIEALKNISSTPWILGFGCNVLVSDRGLPGTTLIWRGGAISVDGTSIIADAGVWWDDIVQTALAHNLWGIELMSDIPSSVGGAIYGNIAAYGSQVSDTLEWLEVYNTESHTIERHAATDFSFSYRRSSLQDAQNYIILRASFKLHTAPVCNLRYESALAIAEEKGYSTTTLEGLRHTIIETRRRAGSLYNPNDTTTQHTAGSFFKNPIVDFAQAKELAHYDESGKTLERVLQQNAIHGGSAQRASAAHVLLAAGFYRGQRWDKVELNSAHVLKVTTLPGATASEVYKVIQEIQQTVQQKLGIALEPEVKFLGF